MKLLLCALTLGAASLALAASPTPTPKPKGQRILTCDPYAERCPACKDCSRCKACSKEGNRCSVKREREGFARPQS